MFSVSRIPSYEDLSDIQRRIGKTDGFFLSFFMPPVTKTEKINMKVNKNCQ